MTFRDLVKFFNRAGKKIVDEKAATRKAIGIRMPGVGPMLHQPRSLRRILPE